LLGLTGPTIFTIGHSDHTAGEFVALLDRHDISSLVDTRSTPHSAYLPHFNREFLSHRLGRAGVRYLWMGDALGGKPQDKSLYDSQGVPDYARMRAAASFKEAIDKLVKGARLERIAVMCGEEDPANCHRRLLVGHALVERGIHVVHIRGDCGLEPEHVAGLYQRVADRGAQLALIAEAVSPYHA